MAESAALPPPPPPPPPPAFADEVRMAPLPPPASNGEVHIPNTTNVDADRDDTVPSRRKRGGVKRLVNISFLVGRLRSRKTKSDHVHFKSTQEGLVGTPRSFHHSSDDSPPSSYDGKESPAYMSPAQTSEGGMSTYQSAINLSELDRNDMINPSSVTNLAEFGENRMSKPSSFEKLAEFRKNSIRKYASDSNLAGVDESNVKGYGSASNLAERDRKGNDGAGDVDNAEGGDIDAKADDFIAHFYQEMRLQRKKINKTINS